LLEPESGSLLAALPVEDTSALNVILKA
jgi:hypothetical protein